MPDLDDDSLRRKYYNATIIERIDVHADLARFRIRCDAPHDEFEAGQYVAVGMGLWEPRLPGTQEQTLTGLKRRKMVWRAYSISCPLLSSPDADGRLLHHNAAGYLEFYVALVRDNGEGNSPPELTPRWFAASVGDRLAVKSRIVGHYTLGDVQPDHTVALLGTGTGEAPHNAMVADLLLGDHRGPIVVATTVRTRADAAYLPHHLELMRRHANYRYFALTTREPENLDASHPDYVGKQYLQTLWGDGRLAQMAGASLSPESTHVMLCGNPAMIGAPEARQSEPAASGMLAVLAAAGFDIHANGPGAGTARYEKYW